MFSRLVDFMARHCAVSTAISVVVMQNSLVLRVVPGLSWLRKSEQWLHLGVVSVLAGMLPAHTL